MGDKVICQVCAHQTDGFCALKKTRVKLKKKRLCDKFKQDTSKIKIKKNIPTVKRPDWFWDREERRRLYKEELRKYNEVLNNREKNEAQTVNTTKDSKYPLTGDLSRFKTTVSKEEK